jgi:hypothetical protein
MADRNFKSPLFIDAYSSQIHKDYKPPLENLNYATGTQWQFTLTAIPGLEYFVRSAPIPSINMGSVIQPTPHIDINRSGDKITYEPLMIEFFVDERWENWNQLQRWLRGIAAPEGHIEFDKLGENLHIDEYGYSDASHILYTNDGTELFRIEYQDCFPMALETIPLDTQSDGSPLVCMLTIQYRHYVVKRMPEGVND